MKRMIDLYNLAIIGGGPAGTSAARVAGQKGLKTILFEKDDFPREKPCGGGLSESALDLLDFEIPPALVEREIYGARIAFGPSQIERYKQHRLAILIKRSKFDSLLMKKAEETGVEIHMGEKVKSVNRIEDHLEIITSRKSYSTRFCIIAEGAHGALKYLVRKKDKRNRVGFCLSAKIKAKKNDTNGYLSNGVEINFGLTDMGYGWVFPHRDYFSIGIGDRLDKLEKPKEKIIKFLQQRGFPEQCIVRGHLIPYGGYRRKVSTHNMLLAGDAAGFVDGFLGEGLTYAIGSGQIAARVISRIVLQNLDPRALNAYKKECGIQFIENLRYSLLFSRLMHRFPSLMFNAFTRNEEMVDVYLDVVAGRKTYKQYLKWILSKIPKILFKKI